jgi:hypothetical protein
LYGKGKIAEKERKQEKFIHEQGYIGFEIWDFG